MSTPLENYAKSVHKNACFDSIVEIEKAIRNKDEAGVLLHLGQLREQLWVIRYYIESLESGSDAAETCHPKEDLAGAATP